MKPGVKLMVWTVLAAAAIAIGAVPARAQETVTAKVPFDFWVGKTHMPSGDYVIAERADPTLLSIANRSGDDFSFALTIGASPDPDVQEPELVFVRVGGQYLLWRVVVEPGNAREIPVTPEIKAHAVDRVAVMLRAVTHAN